MVYYKGIGNVPKESKGVISMKMKKIAATLLAALMLTTAATPAYAGDVVEVSGEIVSVNDNDFAIETQVDPLYDYMLKKTFSGFGVSPYASNYGDTLFEAGSTEHKIYQYLKQEIIKIAEDGGSAIIEIPQEIFGDISTTLTAGMSVEQIKAALATEYANQVDKSKIIRCLMVDCAYEFYWFDKTIGWSNPYGLSYRSGESAKITSMSFNFNVASAYQAEDNFTVTNEVTAVSEAVANAAEIVAKYADSSISDMYRLYAFKEEICALVDYNYPAAENEDTPYGDPWQLIHVFDGDSSTMVVCEGYAKAFKYLCDLAQTAGHFDDENFACYIVTGRMLVTRSNNSQSGGNHMWNIVTLDSTNDAKNNSKNYLVDVTNSEDSSNWAGALFMNADTIEGSWDSSYRIINKTNLAVDYTYIDSQGQSNTLNIYPSEILQIDDNKNKSIKITGLPGQKAKLVVSHSGTEIAITETSNYTNGFASIPYIEWDEYTLAISCNGYAPRSFTTNFKDENYSDISVFEVSANLHLLGDLDGKNGVDTTDIAAVLAHLRGQSPLTGYAYTCADYDQNGTVNTRDVILMLKALKG